MNYASINIGELLDTYMYADRPDNFEGFVCDGDKQQISDVFSEA